VSPVGPDILARSIEFGIGTDTGIIGKKIKYSCFAVVVKFASIYLGPQIKFFPAPDIMILDTKMLAH
jgi:hypothetical protein